MYDYLIVGAGITGATLAHCLHHAGKRVTVIERRNHLAGNCHDATVEGIRVHTHGGHIFHTNNDRVWQFVNQFAWFQQYEHRVKVSLRGDYYSFPPNKMTAQQMFSAQVPEEICINLFYKPFSEKAWGRQWEDIPEAIRRRVPMRSTWDDRYFTDAHQGLPVCGYADMVMCMLWGIPLELGADYCRDERYWRRMATKVIYCGALDELMEYTYGKLEYRSLQFETKVLDTDDYQGCPTVNYPEAEVPYTVVNEWKHYGWQGEPKGKTVVTWQTPAGFEETGERYYPYIDDENRERHARYVNDLETGIIPAGRLGKFRYLNMDQAIGAALAMAEKELAQ
jgi:UDP-galactopyranose mutase